MLAVSWIDRHPHRRDHQDFVPLGQLPQSIRNPAAVQLFNRKSLEKSFGQPVAKIRSKGVASPQRKVENQVRDAR